MKPMNLLDRAIAYINPVKGATRAKARGRIAAYDTMQAAYDATSPSPHNKRIGITSNDANTEILASGTRLRDIVNDLVRNNPHAAAARLTYQTYMVGSGIIPQATAKRKERAEQVDQLITTHFDSTDIDADGRHDLYGLQALAVGTMVVAGSVLIRRRRRTNADGYALPFQIQVMEPDFLDKTVDGPMTGSNYAIQGIEFNSRGVRVAYHLFDEHPGGLTHSLRNKFISRRIPADDVIHMYRMDRPGQVEGVSWFAPVITRIWHYQDFSIAQLLRQKVAAMFAMFWWSTEEEEEELDEDGNEKTDSGHTIEKLEPGLIQRLPGGSNVEMADPPGVDGYETTQRVTLHEIAVGLGMPVEELTGDYNRFNFSSGRMSRLGFHRRIQLWQSQTILPQFCGGVSRWTAQAVKVVTMSNEPFGIEWTPQPAPMVNPKEEVAVAKDKVRAGLNSRMDEIKKLGRDPEVVEAEIEADNKRADDKKFVFDSDPRTVTAQGQAQADTPSPDQSEDKSDNKSKDDE